MNFELFKPSKLKSHKPIRVLIEYSLIPLINNFYFKIIVKYESIIFSLSVNDDYRKQDFSNYH